MKSLYEQYRKEHPYEVEDSVFKMITEEEVKKALDYAYRFANQEKDYCSCCSLATTRPEAVERVDVHDAMKLLNTFAQLTVDGHIRGDKKASPELGDIYSQIIAALTTPATVPSEAGRYRMSVPVEISACNLPCSHGDETGCKRLLLTWPDGDVNCADAFFNGATFTKEPE